MSLLTIGNNRAEKQILTWKAFCGCSSSSLTNNDNTSSTFSGKKSLIKIIILFFEKHMFEIHFTFFFKILFISEDLTAAFKFINATLILSSLRSILICKLTLVQISVGEFLNS
jgi:hypothetical protein